MNLVATLPTWRHSPPQIVTCCFLNLLFFPGVAWQTYSTKSIWRSSQFSKNKLEFFLHWPELSLNSGNLINHWNMNWAQFKDSAFHMWLAGTVVASWSLTQEVEGSSPFTVMKRFLVTEFAEIGKTQMIHHQRRYWILYFKIKLEKGRFQYT